MKKKICPGVFDAGHWAKNENNRNPPKNFPNIFFVLLLLSKMKSKINSLAKCVCVIFWPANTLCISIDYYTCIDGPYYCLIHSAWAIHQQQQQQRGPFISYSPLIPKNTTQSSSRDRARDLLFRCRAPTI